MRNALKKLESKVSDTELEQLADLACHIEECSDPVLFNEVADILERYCTDYMIVEKLAAVIREAAEFKYGKDNDLK